MASCTRGTDVYFKHMLDNAHYLERRQCPEQVVLLQKLLDQSHNAMRANNR